MEDNRERDEQQAQDMESRLESLDESIRETEKAAAASPSGHAPERSDQAEGQWPEEGADGDGDDAEADAPGPRGKGGPAGGDPDED